MAKQKIDIYQRVTDSIVAKMESDLPPWQKPWTGGIAISPLRANGVRYRGINVLMLMYAADEGGYAAPRWITYNQAQELGGQVQKGEKSSLVVKAGTFLKEVENGAGDVEAVQRSYMRSYNVFNAEQCDGLPAEFYEHGNKPIDFGTCNDPDLDAVFDANGATLLHGGSRAYYSPDEDLIKMPPIKNFKGAGAYYATLAHEFTHWTGHKSRLDRAISMARQKYAFEELVAELGSAMIGAALGIEPDFDQNAAYIAGWIKCLKEDKKAIFNAATLAQAAADYVLGHQKAA